jgi:hypothetical protein
MPRSSGTPRKREAPARACTRVADRGILRSHDGRSPCARPTEWGPEACTPPRRTLRWAANAMCIRGPRPRRAAATGMRRWYGRLAGEMSAHSAPGGAEDSRTMLAYSFFRDVFRPERAVVRALLRPLTQALLLLLFTALPAQSQHVIGRIVGDSPTEPIAGRDRDAAGPERDARAPRRSRTRTAGSFFVVPACGQLPAARRDDRQKNHGVGRIDVGSGDCRADGARTGGRADPAGGACS